MYTSLGVGKHVLLIFLACCAKGICFPSTLDPSEEKGKNKREIAGQSGAVEVRGKNPTSFNRTMAQPEKKKKKSL